MGRLAFQFPYELERRYQVALLAVVRRGHKRAWAALKRHQDRLDAAIPNVWQTELDKLATSLLTPADLATITQQLTTLGQAAVQNVQADPSLRAAFGGLRSHQQWEGDLVDEWRQQNVDLIKTIPTRLHDELRGVVQKAFADAWPWKRLSESIQQRFSVNEFVARRIARDQMGKLHGQLTQARQEAAGVKRYIWRTSKDERVRPEHAARENVEFSWDVPPDDGHPGIPIQCRCHAEPVLDEMVVPTLPETPTQQTTQPTQASAAPEPAPSAPRFKTLMAARSWLESRGIFYTQDGVVKDRRGDVAYKPRLRTKSAKRTRDEHLAFMQVVADEVDRMEAAGAPRAAFQNLAIMDRDTAGARSGEAFKRRFSRSTGMWRELSLQAGAFSNGGNVRWRAVLKPDRQSPESLLRDIFRHELGHTLQSGQHARQVNAMLNDISDRVPTGFESTWVRQNVSEYATTSLDELIAEVFAQVTDRDYVRGTLPKPCEDLADAMLNDAAITIRRVDAA